MQKSGSRFATILAWSLPASVALATFFSWIMLINSLRVPFYLYYMRTIFLIYTSRSLDPLIWLASSGLTLILVAAESQGRSRWSWPSVLLLWLGTTAGALVDFLVSRRRERTPPSSCPGNCSRKLTGLGVEPFLRFAYIGLILAFGLTIFVLIFTASRNKPLATVSALVSTVSVSTTGGMYTGTIAEWIALIVCIMSLIFLVIASQNRRGQFISICGLTIGSLVVLFIHPWTWIAMMVGLIAYCAIVLLVRPKRYLREIGSVLLVIFFNAAGLALSLFALLRTQGWRVANAFSLVQGSLGSKYFGLGSWEILVFFSQIWSQFLNPVLLGLSILGVIVLARRRDRLSWIVLAWIVAACATNVLAAPMGYNPLDVNRGETQIFRAMFLTPFQVPAAIGLLQDSKASY
jgi:hypothetical protein